MKPILIGLLAPAFLGASLIVTGDSPIGYLAQAQINIPLNPNHNPIPRIQQYSDQTWNGTFTVTGGTGQGYLYVEMMAFAESFGGSPHEYMDSEASITYTGGVLQSQPWVEGSAPAGCDCPIAFTFGIPQQVQFHARAYVSYEYHPDFPSTPYPQLLEGSTILAFDQIMGVHVGWGSQEGYSVNFIDPPIATPEGNSFWLGLTGLILAQTVLSTVKEKRV